VLGPRAVCQELRDTELYSDPELAEMYWQWASKVATDPKQAAGRCLAPMAKKHNAMLLEMQEQHVANEARQTVYH
jgi:hypothetical protein